MSCRFWRILALAVGALMAVSFLLLVSSPKGVAHAQSPVSVVVDMDPTNGTGPCNPIDTSRNTVVGETYQVAICLVNMPPLSGGIGGPPAAFNFQLVYDDTLNHCVAGAAGSTYPPGLDSDPNANAGATVFSTPSLGPNFECTSSGAAPPSCDTDPATGPGHGKAYLGCLSAVGPYNLPVGQGVASPLAEVTFTAVATGTDAMSVQDASVASGDTNEWVACYDNVGICGGGTDVIAAAPVTATPTPTGHLPSVGGKVLLAPAAVAAESSETSKGSDRTVATWAALAAVLLPAGGWYARRRRLH